MFERIRLLAVAILLALAQHAATVHAFEHCLDEAPGNAGHATCCLAFHGLDNAAVPEVAVPAAIPVPPDAISDTASAGALPSEVSAYLSRAPPRDS